MTDQQGPHVMHCLPQSQSVLAAAWHVAADGHDSANRGAAMGGTAGAPRPAAGPDARASPPCALQCGTRQDYMYRQRHGAASVGKMGALSRLLAGDHWPWKVQVGQTQAHPVLLQAQAQQLVLLALLLLATEPVQNRCCQEDRFRRHRHMVKVRTPSCCRPRRDSSSSLRCCFSSNHLRLSPASCAQGPVNFQGVSQHACSHACGQASGAEGLPCHQVRRVSDALCRNVPASCTRIWSSSAPCLHGPHHSRQAGLPGHTDCDHACCTRSGTNASGSAHAGSAGFRNQTCAPSGRAACRRSATTASAFCLRDTLRRCWISHSCRCLALMPAVGSCTSAHSAPGVSSWRAGGTALEKHAPAHSERGPWVH